MDAAAARVQTQVGTPAITPQTTTDASNGAPAVEDLTPGNGPVKPKGTVKTGTLLLPAPEGKPKRVHLPDGSVLVPLKRFDLDGMPAASPGAGPKATTGGGDRPDSEPDMLLYNGNFYKEFIEELTPEELSDMPTVKDRLVRSTLIYLREERPEVKDFAIRDVKVRRVDPVADRDLLAVSPRTRMVAHVRGATADGTELTLPSLLNDDGSLLTDPRLTGR